MKKALLMCCILMAAASYSQSQVKISLDVIVGNRPPAPNEVKMMQAEEAQHPNIAKAMHDIEASMRSLHDAPDDFGGNKAQAESDLKQAYVSLRRALYYRLYENKQHHRR